MSDLIDREALLDELWKQRRNYQLMDDTQTADKIMHGLYRAEQALKDAPTIDAVPVVHGEWVFQGTGGSMGTKTCSVCGYQSWQSKLRMANMGNYCPNCGARMGERRES